MVRIAISVEAFEAIARTLPLGSVGYEPEANERGERLVWLEGPLWSTGWAPCATRREHSPTSFCGWRRPSAAHEEGAKTATPRRRRRQSTPAMQKQFRNHRERKCGDRLWRRLLSSRKSLPRRPAMVGVATRDFSLVAANQCRTFGRRQPRFKSPFQLLQDHERTGIPIRRPERRGEPSVHEDWSRQRHFAHGQMPAVDALVAATLDEAHARCTQVHMKSARAKCCS